MGGPPTDRCGGWTDPRFSAVSGEAPDRSVGLSRSSHPLARHCGRCKRSHLCEGPGRAVTSDWTHQCRFWEYVFIVFILFNCSRKMFFASILYISKSFAAIRRPGRQGPRFPPLGATIFPPPGILPVGAFFTFPPRGSSPSYGISNRRHDGAQRTVCAVVSFFLQNIMFDNVSNSLIPPDLCKYCDLLCFLHVCHVPMPLANSNI